MDPAAVNLAVPTTLCFSSLKMCLFWRNTERPFHKRRLLLRTDMKHSRDKAISMIYRCRVLEILIVHYLFVSAEMMTCSCQPSDLCLGDPRFLIRPYYSYAAFFVIPSVSNISIAPSNRPQLLTKSFTIHHLWTTSSLTWHCVTSQLKSSLNNLPIYLYIFYKDLFSPLYHKPAGGTLILSFCYTLNWS